MVKWKLCSPSAADIRKRINIPGFRLPDWSTCGKLRAGPCWQGGCLAPATGKPGPPSTNRCDTEGTT